MDHWQDAARARGLNPYHPDTWTLKERHAMQRWKLDRFRARWRHLQSLDYPALVRAQSGRARLLELVRADLFAALTPFPARPYKVCPCHPHRFGLGKPGVDPWVVDRKLDATTTAGVLRWLTDTFGRRAR